MKKQVPHPSALRAYGLRMTTEYEGGRKGGRPTLDTEGSGTRNGNCEGGNALGSYSTQSAMNTFVSCGARPFRSEDHTSLLPSDENIGKASNPG